MEASEEEPGLNTNSDDVGADILSDVPSLHLADTNKELGTRLATTPALSSTSRFVTAT